MRLWDKAGITLGQNIVERDGKEKAHLSKWGEEVADATSVLLKDVFGKDKSPCRLVYGVASLPLGILVKLDIIFEVAG